MVALQWSGSGPIMSSCVAFVSAHNCVCICINLYLYPLHQAAAGSEDPWLDGRMSAPSKQTAAISALQNRISSPPIEQGALSFCWTVINHLQWIRPLSPVSFHCRPRYILIYHRWPRYILIYVLSNITSAYRVEPSHSHNPTFSGDND